MIEPVLVRGSSRLIGILGDPVGHSLSPLIHNHVFARKGLPFVYVPLPVKTEHLGTVITALRHCNFAGANVTIPHKQEAVYYCDTLSEISQLTGTVNTLYLADGLLHGTTTDAEGFFRSLDTAGASIADSHVVILGNGGTARTLAFAIASLRTPRSLSLVGRSAQRVAPLAQEISRRTGCPVAHLTFDAPELDQALARCTLLVNCTSVGMAPDINRSPLEARRFHAGMTVFDTIYNPARTLFLQYADQAGCRGLNGLTMLLYQGLASLRYWTGVEAGAELFDLDELQGMVTRKG
jgi:shikimate dehydrogenase